MKDLEEEARRLRRRMVDLQIRDRAIRDSRVLRALETVPRHRFAPELDLADAYSDAPHSIGYRQTISQPYMVALMSALLELEGGERVLEIGTGSGYQTAVLAELGAEVYTIERLAPLGERAKRVLEALGYESIHFRNGDGTLGWTDEAPFDRILVTAGAETVPPTLAGQLTDGGTLLIPIGPRSQQDLLAFRREGDRLLESSHCRCAFVRLIGREGWSEDD